ncbi:hypothetical protein NZNM25_09840 [Nitrosopumilus zosterae]|uniref:Uncharacterized protein n=1 Tax=Nitrosopumilus zosterae TaxID=718286 RepID=A0A2S2KRB4_9ARCH|nr:hypothetical protein [Nitrosopumilus zosterae]BDQ30375.1 hypothetical protein NZOSNM25_000477 [Nitrosopumilus zosterae]GBH34193.1 hypothetical protein NZNM25_09840 [Nitrosopumilus zosterae]
MKKIKFANNILGLSLITLLSFSILSTSVFGETPKNPNVHSIKIQYVTKVSDNSYYVNFKACIGKNHVNTPTFAVTTDTNSKFITYDKIHLANTCKTYDASVNAKHTSSISIQMIDTVVKK